VLTLSIYSLSWLLLTLLVPVWLPLALLIGIARRRSFVILRLLVFGWFYLGFELLALVRVAGVFVTSRSEEARNERLYRLQSWWAAVTLSVVRSLLQLRFEVEDVEAAARGPAILLIRHVSILDTLLPCAYVQRPYGLRVRYILKQELLFDPCLDIVGNALPNYFVDRTGNSLRELDGVRSLVSDLRDDGVLIFPEGTRFSFEKRRGALARLDAQSPELADLARGLTHVLPPKPGGVLTLLEALPGTDCVIFAHTGLEGLAKVKDVLSGAVVGSTVRIRCWRIPATAIPPTADQRLRWLFAEWKKVDTFIGNTTETS
jgi:1-acyl-sn-glycerol-3-phosphate acyltransferase